jgi:hypothetical protein
MLSAFLASLATNDFLASFLAVANTWNWGG